MSLRALIAIWTACLLGLLVIAFFHYPAHAKWNPLTSGISTEQISAYHDWFLAQKQETGAPCCGDEEHYGGDGHYVNVRRIGNVYQVFVKELGFYATYEGPVNPNHENPTGQNVAWYVVDGHDIRWYCLRLASGT